jgi:hypothetical protein
MMHEITKGSAEELRFLSQLKQILPSALPRPPLRQEVFDLDEEVLWDAVLRRKGPVSY